MKKLIILCVAMLFITTLIQAQVATSAANLTKTKTNLKEGWAKGGTLNLTFNEAGRNDYWIKGGEKSALGIRGLVDYNFDQKKGKITWLNSVRARYGVQRATSTGNMFLKNDDFFNYNTTYGNEFRKHWSYAGFLVPKPSFKTFL